MTTLRNKPSVASSERTYRRVRSIPIALTVLAMCVWPTSAPADWDPGEDHKMHYPQLPDTDGWDVAWREAPGLNDYYLADDWQCSESGWIDNIHFWISHKNELDCPDTDFPHDIREVRIRICDNLPVGHPENPFDYPIPGDPIGGPGEWQFRALDQEFTVRGYAIDWQGWFHPRSGEYLEDDHLYTYQINIPNITETVDEPGVTEPVWQEAGQTYWLKIRIIKDEDCDEYLIGWKNSDSTQFGGNAVFWNIGQPADGPEELYDPITGDPLDLSFVIAGEKPEYGACCCDDWTCYDGLTVEDCLFLPEDCTYVGVGTTCGGGIEACCLDDHTCQDLDPTCCEVLLDGTPLGPQSSCAGYIVACCLDNGSCINADEACCEDLWGWASPEGYANCLGDADPYNGVDDACEEEGNWVVCEPQGGPDPTHPLTYWYDVTPISSYCDFHVLVFDPDPSAYTNWVAPPGWNYGIQQVAREYWASWWDPTPGCQNALSSYFRFQFDHSRPDSAWSPWTMTNGGGSDPTSELADASWEHWDKLNGYGAQVHAPLGPTEACCLWNGFCIDVPYNDCLAAMGNPQGIDTDCSTTECDPIKWAAPPLPPLAENQSSEPLCFWGWDHLSLYGSASRPILADDWICETDKPVAGIHWWGSYQGWIDTATPPSTAPEYFHVGIWSDSLMSHPQQLIWEATVPRDELDERVAGCDYHPSFMSAPDVCWRYDFAVPEEDWFYQGQSCEIFWISVSAMYSTCSCDGDVDDNGDITFDDVVAVLNCIEGDCSGCVNPCDVNCDEVVDSQDIEAVTCLFEGGSPEECCSSSVVSPQYAWGWKTREEVFGSGFVEMTDPHAPHVGDVWGSGNEPWGWDLSFAVTTVDEEEPTPEITWRIDDDSPTNDWASTLPYWEHMDLPVLPTCSQEYLDPVQPYYAATDGLVADYSGYRFYAKIWLDNSVVDHSNAVIAELRKGEWDNEGTLLSSAMVYVTDNISEWPYGVPYLFDFGTIDSLVMFGESLVLKIIYYGDSDDTRVYWNGVNCPSALHALAPGYPGVNAVICEPQGNGNPEHPGTYWYDVTPDWALCDFHVRVYDPNPGNYTNRTLPPNVVYPGQPSTWDFAVHQVGDESWASWWDGPECENVITDTFRFQFDNDSPSTWGQWTTTIGFADNPHEWVEDFAGHHFGEPDGYGYRVHVPSVAEAACCVGDACSVTTHLGCRAIGGDWLGPGGVGFPILDCMFDPCATGACCFTSGECEDGPGYDTWAQCEAIAADNVFHGGVTCDADPCVLPPDLPQDPEHQARKNRYISIDPTTNAETPVAIEVQLSSMKRCSGDLRRSCIVDADCPTVCSADFDRKCETDLNCSLVGAGTCVPTSPCVVHPDVGTVTKWIDEPFASSCVPQNDCSTQMFAHLADDPVIRVWTEDTVHVTDCEVVPVASYELRATANGVIFSSPLLTGTIEKPQRDYGDCVGPGYGPPDGICNITDVQAYLVAVNAMSFAPHTTWVDLHGGIDPVISQQILNVSDLQQILLANAGRVYTATPGQYNPGACPP